MCQDCVRRHIERLLANTQRALHKPGASQIILYFEELVPCSSFDIEPRTGSPARRKFTFPGRSDHEALTFTIFLRLCGLLLENLRANKVVPIRDLYYQDVGLFKTQQTVGRALDRLSHMWLIPREALNVLPSPNGLVAGDLQIALESGDICKVSRSNGSSLIPVSRIMYTSCARPPRFILVVEKEAVFTHLQNELQEGLIITGKGFPDHATRRLLKTLTVTYPQVPVYALVDSDPHGILIARCYERGSERSIERQEQLSLTYLGVSLLEYTDGLVPNTLNDMRLAMSTLRRGWIHEPRYAPCKAELQRGLFMGLKGEMNLLDQDQGHRLSSYVRTKLALLQGSQNSSTVAICTSQESLQADSRRPPPGVPISPRFPNNIDFTHPTEIGEAPEHWVLDSFKHTIRDENLETAPSSSWLLGRSMKRRKPARAPVAPSIARMPIDRAFASVPSSQRYHGKRI